MREATNILYHDVSGGCNVVFDFTYLISFLVGVEKVL